MNKDVFHGFINGVVAMYQLGSILDYHLLMEWECEQIGNGMLKITCDYCYERYDKLLRAGDYENPPEYEEIENRDKIVIEVHSRDTVEIAKQINNNILDYLSTIHPIYTTDYDYHRQN
jgi:hypothetical protein